MWEMERLPEPAQGLPLKWLPAGAWHGSKSLSWVKPTKAAKKAYIQARNDAHSKPYCLVLSQWERERVPEQDRIMSALMHKAQQGKARKRERAKQSPETTVTKENPETQASHLPQKGHLPRYKRNSWGKRCLEKARLPVQEHRHLVQTPLKPCPHKR